MESIQQYEILNCTQTVNPNYNISYYKNTNLYSYTNYWTLHLDNSKSKEGASARCILKDPQGNKTLIACLLEFQCTNDTIEYNALVQGLKTVVDLNVRFLKVFGNLEIILKEV